MFNNISRVRDTITAIAQRAMGLAEAGEQAMSESSPMPTIKKVGDRFECSAYGAVSHLSLGDAIRWARRGLGTLELTKKDFAQSKGEDLFRVLILGLRPADLSLAQTESLAEYLNTWEGERSVLSIEARKGIADVLTALGESEGPCHRARDESARIFAFLMEDIVRDRCSGFAHAQVLTALRPWADEPWCAKAVSAIARDWRPSRDLRQTVDMICAASKWPSDQRCAWTVSVGAGRLSSSIDGLSPEDLANVIAALSKLPSDPRCAETAPALAQRLLENGVKVKLSGPEAFSSVAALRKWPSNETCAKAVSELERVLDRMIADLGPQDLANVITALSEWPSDPWCAETASALAQRLLDSDAKIKLSRKKASKVVAALRTWPLNKSCAEVASKLERFVSDRFNKTVVDVLLFPHDRVDTAKSPAE